MVSESKEERFTKKNNEKKEQIQVYLYPTLREKIDLFVKDSYPQYRDRSHFFEVLASDLLKKQEVDINEEPNTTR